jgi:integrase
LKSVKTFFGWCVGQAILDRSPAEGVPLPKKEVARDRVLDDAELVQVLLAARTMGGPYGAIVEFLALTAQRREEVAGLRWDEMDLAQRVWTIPKARTKNAKAHMVHLSKQALAVLERTERKGPVVFTLLGTKSFQDFTHAKRRLDELSGVTEWRLHDLRRTCVSGMARLGVAPHIADKILNHQAGTISGVAAVYQRHDFIAERRAALDEWGEHIDRILDEHVPRGTNQRASHRFL